MDLELQEAVAEVVAATCEADSSEDEPVTEMVYRNAASASLRVQLPETVLHEVATATDGCIRRYLDSIVGYPESGVLDMSPLLELGLDGATVAGAMAHYLQHSFENWADALLEAQSHVLGELDAWTEALQQGLQKPDESSVM